MDHIDLDAINSDLQTRVEYLVRFIEFREEDIQTLRRAAPFAKSKISDMVDSVYSKLFSFDVTRASFLHRHAGFEGDVPHTLDEVTLDAPQIQFRKDFLKVWAVRMFTLNYSNLKSWEYFDNVGIMHTGVAGFKHRENLVALRVEYMHLAMSLGYLEDILLTTFLSESSIDLDERIRIVRAINKVMWIQNDLLSRHYIQLVPSPENH